MPNPYLRSNDILKYFNSLLTLFYNLPELFGKFNVFEINKNYIQNDSQVE